MKYTAILFLILIFLNSSCSDDDDYSPINIEGAYIGTFERNGITSNVEVKFSEGIFVGESETEKFPGICEGSFSISNNVVEFINGCVWTADFDWSLILAESWEYTLQNNTLILTKLNGDKYILTKQ